MIDIHLRTEFSGVMRMLDKLPDDLHDKALSMAMNKVGAKAKTEMVRGITQEFAIKASEVREQVYLTRASKSGSNLRVVLEAFGKRRGHRSRNVMLFAAKQTKQGVTVKILKGGGRKLIKGAFIANQGRTVFIREGKKRLPIKGVETIDVPQMFNTRRVSERVMHRIRTELPVEVDRAVKVVLARIR